MRKVTIFITVLLLVGVVFAVLGCPQQKPGDHPAPVQPAGGDSGVAVSPSEPGGEVPTAEEPTAVTGEQEPGPAGGEAEVPAAEEPVPAVDPEAPPPSDAGLARQAPAGGLATGYEPGSKAGGSSP